MKTVIRTAAVAVATALLTAVGGIASAQAQPITAGGSVVAYGHSWPDGYGVTRSYPAMVASALQRTYVDRARGGDLVAGTSARAQLRPPNSGDVVILETGLNDARAYGMAGIDAYRDFLTSTLVALAPAQRVVIVLEQRIPRWHKYAPYNHGSAKVMGAYNRVARQVARTFSNTQVIHPQLRLQRDFQGDGVHPDASGHAHLARSVERAVLR